MGWSKQFMPQYKVCRGLQKLIKRLRSGIDRGSVPSYSTWNLTCRNIFFADEQESPDKARGHAKSHGRVKAKMRVWVGQAALAVLIPL